MSKSRILKKKFIQARSTWLVDHLGCIKRGTLVEYFSRHPKDFSRVARVSRRLNYKDAMVNLVRRDIRTNYHHIGFDLEENYTNWTVHQIEHGDFRPYLKYKKMKYIIAPECELQNIVQTIPNPYKL